MNNPFFYTPSAEMLREQRLLAAHIEKMCAQSPAFAREIEKGKMFGILRCRHADGRALALWAFSGQIGGRFDWEGFVPPVFDYLDENGHFRREERAISALSSRIRQLEESAEALAARRRVEEVRKAAEADIDRCRAEMKAAKALRAERRAAGEPEAALTAESQFMKAELHRCKLRWRRLAADAESALAATDAEARRLRMERSLRSDHLQQWLFAQFVFATRSGRQVSLAQVNARLQAEQSSLGALRPAAAMPLPSGTGECCEPKLLHHAFSRGLVAEEIGMFWWGESPRAEVRHHLHFYPACGGKCKPLLGFLLESDCATQHPPRGAAESLRIVFEDDHLLVIDKPAGLLSVPGKTDAESVVSLLRSLSPLRPGCQELAVAHRLDMDTSGLLLVAKTRTVHRQLQTMFALRQVHKTYVALLERPLDSEGQIELPLAPDYLDRPRQKVDTDSGKAAVTRFRPLGGNRVELCPLTGRTHQLRVHCAHHLGLGNPILGDRLYGTTPHPRLCLHAAELRLVHPVTGQALCFRSKAAF